MVFRINTERREMLSSSNKMVAPNAVQSLRGQCSENPFSRWRSDSDARRCLGGFGGLSDFLRGQ